MDYYLSRRGQNRGVFPEEELRRQRVSGELEGTEYVWRDGMSQWEKVDVVLGPPVSTPKVPTPIPAAALKKTINRKIVWGTVFGVLLAVAGVVMFGVAVLKVVRQAQVARTAGT